MSNALKIKAYLFSFLDYCAIRILRFTGKTLISKFDREYLQPTKKDIRVHYKIEYLLKLCTGKRVAHFGFVDSPFTEVSVHTDTFLHLQLKKVCGELLGVDYATDAVELYKKSTLDLNVAVADIYDLQTQKQKFENVEIFLLGEILEHLANPGLALKSILDSMPDKALLIITVPNAFSIGPMKGSLNNVEIVHHDHKSWYSLFTLQVLLKSCGFRMDEACYYVSGKGRRVGFFSRSFPSLSEGIIGVFGKDASPRS